MRYLMTAVVALSLLLYSCSSDSDQADDETQSEEATESATAEPEPAEPSPEESEIDAAISLAPAAVPAATGPVEVTVDGQGFSASSVVMVFVCPGLQGDPNTSSVSGDFSARCGIEQSAAEARDQGMLANVKPDAVDGGFTATLTVPVTDDAIEDGGVVIAVGDMAIQFWATELLAIE